MGGRKQRRRSFGSVTEMQRGKKYVCRWVENTDKGRKRRSKTIHGTYREACRFLSLKEVEVGEERRAPTLDEAWELWYLPVKERQVEDGKMSARTLGMYSATWSTVRRKWGKVPIDRIRAADVQKWLLDLPKEMARTSLMLMRQVLDRAVMFEALDANKLRVRLELPTSKRWTKDQCTHTLDQIAELASRMRGRREEAAFLICAYGGARVGESLGVKCEDVREVSVEDRRYVSVDIHRQMPEHGHEPLPDGRMKNPQSYRTTIIPWDFGGARLVEIRGERETAGLEWMSVTPDGLPVSLSRCRYGVDQALGNGWGAMSRLRASWRTNAQYSWHAETELLEQLMGHLLPGVTPAHYLRPTFGDLLARFDATFAPTWDK